MAKFHGIVGFATSVEIRPSVYDDEIVERVYKGDLVRTVARWSNGEHKNEDLSFSNKVVIVMDPYGREHFSQIKFVVWKGACLKVSSIDDSEYPRIELELGGVYNGKRADKEETGA